MCTEIVIKNDKGEIITTDWVDCYDPKCPESESPGGPK